MNDKDQSESMSLQASFTVFIWLLWPVAGDFSGNWDAALLGSTRAPDTKLSGCVTAGEAATCEWMLLLYAGACWTNLAHNCPRNILQLQCQNCEKMTSLIVCLLLEVIQQATLRLFYILLPRKIRTNYRTRQSFIHD